MESSLKIFLKRLKIKSQYDKISGLLLYIALCVLLLYLSFIHPLLIVLYIILLIFLYRRERVLFVYCLIFSFIFFIIYFFSYLSFKYFDTSNLIEGVVIEKNDNNFIIKEKLHYIKIYYANIDEIIIGKKIKVSGTVKSTTTRNIENTFSYYRYKLSKRIKYEFKAYNVDILKDSHSIYELKGLILRYIEKRYSKTSTMYLKKLILGISTFDEELNEMTNNEGIVFLFAISGLHIAILSLFIKKILRIFNLPEEIISIILSIILILYLFIASSSVSIIRSIIMILIKEIVENVGKKIPKTDVLTIAFLSTLAINPFYIFSPGFYLSNLSTLIIFLEKRKNYIKLSTTIIIFTLPYLLYNNHKISLFILFYALIFGFIFSKIIIPFTYLVIFICPLDIIYKHLIDLVVYLINVFGEVNIMINISIVNIYILLLIYFVLFNLYKTFKSREKLIKNIGLLFGVLFINYFIMRFSFFPSMKILDVGQGDSILLRSGFKVILVDTGNSDKYHSTLNYLYSQNIKKIDYVFISHKDSDHYAELSYLIENIKIVNVVMDEDDTNYKIGLFNINTYSLNNSNINESSMVLLVKVLGTKILLTGDIEKEGENNLISHSLGHIKYLKVAHHGSSTSSSTLFLNSITPSISLISVGLNNSYGHPNKDVLERLNRIDSQIYRTDIDGSITIHFLFFFEFIKAHNFSDIFFLDNIQNLSIIFLEI